MTSKPPVPDASQSPYPVQEAPHEDAEESGGEAIKAAKEMAASKARWAPSARQIGVGAAIGVGSAAIAAGLLYWRGGRR